MLKSGIYEQLINKELGKQLDVEADRLKYTARIDEAEAAKILTKYISEVIEKELEHVKDNGGSIQSQVKAAAN